jgi:hypothetical protein
MGVDVLKLTLVVALAALPGTVAAADVAVTWEYYVIGTPDIYGPFRGTSPGFRAPVPKRVAQPKKMRLRREVEASGKLEAIVGVDGRTRVARTRGMSGPEVEARMKAVIGAWRFAPATLDGQPTRVLLEISVYQP